jgi:formylglycine-generating enzyme required for sulfatase activity
MGADDKMIARELELCRRFAGSPGGCDAAKLAHERPLHTVTLPAYAIDREEATNDGYDFCVVAGACTPRDHARCETFKLGGLTGGVPEGNPLRAPDHPAVCVTQPQAAVYCRWRGGRLPTEAEWEKAARGTTPRLFPWGEEWDDRVTNWGDEKDGVYGAVDGQALSAPVGSYPRDASPYGARDMGGNVWEWTADWYAADAYTKGVPASGDQRVTRGGGFAANPIAFTTAHRAPQPPGRVAVNIGFRCVLPQL